MKIKFQNNFPLQQSLIDFTLNARDFCAFCKESFKHLTILLCGGIRRDGTEFSNTLSMTLWLMRIVTKPLFKKSLFLGPRKYIFDVFPPFASIYSSRTCINGRLKNSIPCPGHVLKVRLDLLVRIIVQGVHAHA